ncbi:MAG: zinc-binding dehydrogenase [Actinomycetota bacterium]
MDFKRSEAEMRGFITDPAAPGGLRLGDLPDPEPASGEVLVEVHSYSVNRGEIRLLGERTEDWRPGQDVSGVVVRAAADGSGPTEGTRVVGIVDGAGWSELVAVPTARLTALPDDVSYEQAASLPVAGLTALRALRLFDGPLLGRRVLVTGATGGVGHFAVQLARASGAHVTALVSSEARMEEARELRASNVVASLDGDREAFELVLDGVGGETLQEALSRSAPRATVVTYGTVGGRGAEIGLPAFRNAPLARIVGFFVYAVGVETMGADLAVLVHQVEAGGLVPLLGDVREWESTTETIEELKKRGVVGKAVLRVGHRQPG